MLFSIDTQGSFDLTGVAPISGAFSDMPFGGTMIINPELGVGFSVQGHGDQFSPCYLEQNIGAAPAVVPAHVTAATRFGSSATAVRLPSASGVPPGPCFGVREKALVRTALRLVRLLKWRAKSADNEGW